MLLCPSGSTLNIIDCITEPFVVSVHAEDGLVDALLETTIKQWVTVFSKTKNSSLLLDSNAFGNKKIQSSSNDLKIISRHQMTLGGSSRDLDYSMCTISFLHWRMHNLSYIVQTDFLFNKCQDLQGKREEHSSAHSQACNGRASWTASAIISLGMGEIEPCFLR